MKTQSRKEFFRTCLCAAAAGLALPKRARAAGRQEAPADPEKKLLAYCGLDCGKCPAYIATQKNDDNLRAETARKWSAMYGAKISPADINCDGCPTESKRLFSYCGTCEIRKCCREKKLASCAECLEYACDKLTAFLKQAPEAKTILESIRNKGA